ncbi:MAG: peptidoglycan editing factor PgeF [Ectothiorhodospiraceae bacterium]|nr:peptidoglycan editing factor PgeF [Ectothiorhodospiraceae bacterium]
MNHSWLIPDWPAPANVRAVSTTRQGGVSKPPFDSLNLGAAVPDEPDLVRQNRVLLQRQAGMPCAPRWLKQVHGTRVVAAHLLDDLTEADASWTDMPGVPCAVLTADCLPVLFCDRAGTRVAVSHAGWRGLAAGVLEATVNALDVEPAELLAWLGPAIGPEAFEVGDEVRQRFLGLDPGASAAFRPSPQGRWLADLYRLARRRLNGLGVKDVRGGGLCTYTDADRFFSYRRDGETGRMATAIWLERTE